MILDATAGNRMIWGKNKSQDISRAIFIDKEYGFLIEPDIIADNTRLPFRTNFQFTSIIFDPPWGINMPPWWLNKKTRLGSGGIHYFGDFKTKIQLLSYIYKAQEEFKKYTNRLCFKWGERNISLFKILPFFRGWREIYRREINTHMNVGGKSKNRNWWITLIHSSM
jgi:hypothetical protein